MSNSNVRQDVEKKSFPQELQRPFSYHEHDIRYENKKAGITLAGTLTLPQGDGPFPVVILVAGYGPQNRNAEMMGHKPFLVLADHLTKRGVAVLRFDKRGAGMSMGQYQGATSRDFADDVCASIDYLKTRPEVDASKIGLAGHSEGGMIASMVTAERSDLAFLILLAGVCKTDIDYMLEQAAYRLHLDGATDELIAHDKEVRRQMLTVVLEESNADLAEEKLNAIFERYWKNLSQQQQKESEKIMFVISEKNAKAMIKVFNGAWYRYFLTCKPAEMFESISVPVLAINGSRDAIISSHLVLPTLRESFAKGGNSDCTISELPNLNHMFQTCQIGSMAEYATLKETMAPLALDTIADWITDRFC
ncbi:MAG: alpha/beta hydrolase [Epsilonproteobacteria bacterium]|nr:alpha/beta hydrolase [Campylobacterota bacterium]